MKFGLIGHPIARSLSPMLFNAAYDGKYPYDLIQGEDFETSYKRFLDEYDGINVTAPFKELAFAKADIISEECRMAQATNLLVKTPEGIKAYNSDLLGVRLWLQEITASTASGVPAGEKRATPLALFDAGTPEAEQSRFTVLVCGCGGAGKAVAAAAAMLGMKCILMNRDITRAENLAKHINENAAGISQGQIGQACNELATVRPLKDFCECFREADIIIYNIPSAIEEINMLTDKDFNKGTPKHILEANYKNPSFDETFVQKMQETNPEATYTSGRTWLLYQALTGYEIFTGEKPDLAKMSDVL